jgi:hypothetical protein
MSALKALTPFTGYFESMSKPETLKNAEGQPVKRRSVVKMSTEDGQLAFFEIRDAVIERITKLGFQPGDLIKIGFVFIGSEKNGRTYNNLFINHIDYARQN